MPKLNALLPLLTALLLAACGTGGRDPLAGGRVQIADFTDTAATTTRGVVVDKNLLELLEQADEDEQLEVIVSFHGQGGVSPELVAELDQRGLPGLHMRYLPIAGVLGRPAQIRELMQWDAVRSLWHNAELQYEDQAALYMTSVTQAENAPVLSQANGKTVDGSGVTILVNDSGIDATHLDLPFGTKVLANAMGHTNLRSYSSSRPFTPLEGVPNSDLLGSHGTHVAGIAAGLGTLSDGKYEGVATGATLAGYGSGAAILVLDSIGGFDYALQLLDTRPDLNLRIVTNSFGSTSDQGTRFNPDDPTNIATKALADRNIIVIFSAGNSGSGPDSITGNYKKAPWIMIAANGTKDGLLAPSSSRGAIADGEYFVTVDGEKFLVEDRPTVVTPGTDYIAPRATAAEPFTPLDLVADAETGEIQPQHLPFYTYKSGTSMAAPHLAGLTALLLEANPALTWREVKQIFKQTATNMPGYDAWEVGAGYANVEAALAMALELRQDYGSTNNLQHEFNAQIPIADTFETDYAIDFLPVGETGFEEFEVGPDIAIVIAYWNRPDTTTCTCAVTLTNPDGVLYASGLGLPVLAPRVAAAAPAKAGTWKVSVRGLSSVSGVAVDPLGLTNGPSAPATVDLTVELYQAGEAQGLDDIVGHPQQGFIEKAVFEHLVDSRDAGFQPDALLTRGEFAEYLMAWGVRQTRQPFAPASFGDTVGQRQIASAEAVTQRGQLIMDDSTKSRALIEGLAGGQFQPDASVTREDVAYALIQALGREIEVAAHSGDVEVSDGEGGTRKVADDDDIDPAKRGHVADAAMHGILEVEEESGRIYLRPKQAVTRAEFSAMAVRAYALLP